MFLDFPDRNPLRRVVWIWRGHEHGHVVQTAMAETETGGLLGILWGLDGALERLDFHLAFLLSVAQPAENSIHIWFLPPILRAP